MWRSVAEQTAAVCFPFLLPRETLSAFLTQALLLGALVPKEERLRSKELKEPALAALEPVMSPEGNSALASAFYFQKHMSEFL